MAFTTITKREREMCGENSRYSSIFKRINSRARERMSPMEGGRATLLQRIKNNRLYFDYVNEKDENSLKNTEC